MKRKDAKKTPLAFLLAALLTLSAGAESSSSVTYATNELTTVWGRAVTPENVWREYPRPQLVRSGWTSLNGKWEYTIASAASDEPEQYDGTILVPFGVEAPLSGVRRKVTPEDQIWYRRTFEAHPRKGFRTILNFERVDFRTHVFVNGQEATDVPHEGGNVPFSVDVTPFMKDGANELKLLVWDPTDTHLGGTGKQLLEPISCFFPAVSGVCGTVWMEEVPETYLADYKVETNVEKGEVTFTFKVDGLSSGECGIVEICNYGNMKIPNKSSGDQSHNSTISQSFRHGVPITVKLPSPVRLWSPDNPNLYDFKAKYGKDVIKGYFGVRAVGTKLDAKGIRRATVNGEFTYFLATLDQGWWPDGYLTPPSEDALRFDVDFHKKAGFNSIRKHIKVEPRVFYSYCDHVGMMVLQDIPSCRSDKVQSDLQYANKRYGFYRQELKDIVDHLYNHPCIVMWIPFNEGWGQPSEDKTRFANAWLKRYDPSRLLNGASGWNDYEGGVTAKYLKWKSRRGVAPISDVIDSHAYPTPQMWFPPNSKRISIIGEFGCASVSLKGHYQDYRGPMKEKLEPVKDDAWRERVRRRYEELSRPLVKMAREGLAGSVYTEAADQFHEACGMVTFDRAVVKFDYGFLQAIHKEVLDAAREGAEGR